MKHALVKAIAAGGVSYLHDMTYSTIFRSQIDTLEELNAHGAVTADKIKPYYDAALAALFEIPSPNWKV
jgi:hypothetical protein